MLVGRHSTKRFEADEDKEAQELCPHNMLFCSFPSNERLNSFGQDRWEPGGKASVKAIGQMRVYISSLFPLLSRMLLIVRSGLFLFMSSNHWQKRNHLSYILMQTREFMDKSLLNLSGPGDCIEAQRLVLSSFYRINLGLGSVRRGPLEDAKTDAVTPRLNCELQSCPIELLHPPEDCNVNSSLSFTLQICRVEDILVESRIEGSVVHFHRARTIAIDSLGAISASGMGMYFVFT